MTKNKYENNEKYIETMNHLVSATAGLKFMAIENNEVKFKDMFYQITEVVKELRILGGEGVPEEFAEELSTAEMNQLRELLEEAVKSIP